MDRYARMAMKHWQEHLPEMYQELVETGQLEQEAERAAEQTRLEVEELQAAGYQLHEAEEVALPRYILLTPSTDDDWDDLLTDEDRERLARQHGHMRDVLEAKS